MKEVIRGICGAIVALAIMWAFIDSLGGQPVVYRSYVWSQTLDNLADVVKIVDEEGNDVTVGSRKAQAILAGRYDCVWVE